MSIGVLINHTISFLTSPLSVSLTVFAICAIAVWKGARWGKFAVGGGLLLLYLLSAGVTYDFLGRHLELMYPPQRIEEIPPADAILLLGGGTSSNSNRLFYAECAISSDRVLHAFRLYKSGKARRIFVTNESDRLVLIELGVRPEDIAAPSGAANTEQEIKFIARTLGRTDDDKAKKHRPRILLVTSAWHMRRAMLMCQRYADGLSVLPVATDYEALVHDYGEFRWCSLLPSAESLFKTTYMVKEYVGYWGYRLLRSAF